MWLNGLVRKSAGTLQVHIGVREAFDTEDEEMGDSGGSKPVN